MNTSNKAPTAKSGMRRAFRAADSYYLMFFVTLFQMLSFTPAAMTDEGFDIKIIGWGFVYILFEWIYRAVVSRKRRTNFEIEAIAFFFSGIGLCFTASVGGVNAMVKQLVTIIVGVVVYWVLLWYISDVRRVSKTVIPMAIFSLLFLLGSYLYIKFFVGDINGAYNWIVIKGISFQPSEFVKIAFVFVGAATLDKLLTTKNIAMYVIYAMGCIGVLFLMKDFGTALIFFATFLIIAFLRSGSYKAIALFAGAAIIGAGVIIYLMPHVAARFGSYRHVWEDVYGRGYQQTRVLMYSVSGGLFGLGVGNGKLRDVYAANTDLVFGMLCEEMGILMALIVVITFACLLIYCLMSSKSAPSAFYSIAAAAASAMLLVQVSLNIFGITDILPLTGVTLPFISQGGSSMICCWALFAFIKSVDIRAYPGVYRI